MISWRNFVGIWLLLIINTCINAQQEEGNKQSRLRLSDLPVLKKWEIPIKPKAIEIGRRHKDVFAESRKRSFWEMKPEYNLHDLEAEEDPEKVYMDLHYASNMLQDDFDVEDDKKSTKMVTTAGIRENKDNKKENTKKDKLPNPKKMNKVKTESKTFTVTKGSESGDKKRLIAVQPFLSKKEKRKRRNRRSVLNNDEESDDFQDGLYGTMEDMTRERRSTSSVLADFSFDQYDNLDDNGEEDGDDNNEKEETSRYKRSVSKYNQQNNNKRSVSKNSDTNTKSKRAFFQHEVHIKGHKSRSSHMKYPDNAKRYTVSTENKSGVKSDDSEQQRKAKALIQKAFFTSKNSNHHAENAVRHIVPQSASKRTNPPVNVKIVSKNVVDNELDSSSGAKASSNNISRQHISHPDKSPESINTANVARAVAVAMEQLKRDKMWGKVFVHVRPSGELKVMVQETKKMEEE